MELVKGGKGLALMRCDEARQLEKAGHAVIWPKGRVIVPLNLAYLSEKKEDPLIKRVCKVIKKVWMKRCESK